MCGEWALGLLLGEIRKGRKKRKGENKKGAAAEVVKDGEEGIEEKKMEKE